MTGSRGRLPCGRRVGSSVPRPDSLDGGLPPSSSAARHPSPVAWSLRRFGMAHTAADILVDVLHDWGVRVVFGLPGDGINGIMEALRHRREEIRFIQVATRNRRPSWPAPTPSTPGSSGSASPRPDPGGLHLLNGLYDAKLDRAPVLAITGHHYHDLIDTHAQQDVDLDRVFEDVSVYTSRVMGAAHVENVVDARVSHRARLSRGRAHQLSRRPPGAEGRRAVARATSPAHLGRARAARASARSRRSRAGGRDPERRQEDRDPRRPGSARRYRRARAAGRAPGRPRRQAAPRQGGDPRRQPVHHGRRRACSAPGRRRKSWRSATRCCWWARRSRTSSSTRSPARPAASRSTSTPCASASAIRSRSASWAMPATRSRRCCRSSAGTRTASFLARAQDGMREWRALMEEQATRRDRPMKPQVVAHELGKRLRRRAIVSCDSRHHHDVVRPPHPRATRADALAVGHARLDGQRAALRDRGADRVSGAPVRRPSSATADSRCSWPSSPPP